MALLATLLLAASEVVTWHSGPLLAPLLAQDPATTGECIVQVTRPDYGAEPLVTATNTFTCELTHADGTKNVLSLPIGNTPITAWGNRFDRQHAFELHGPVAEQLVRVLNKAYEANAQGGRLDRERLCGPDGVDCLELLSMMRLSADEQPAALNCSRSWRNDQLTETMCSFHSAP